MLVRFGLFRKFCVRFFPEYSARHASPLIPRGVLQLNVRVQLPRERLFWLILVLLCFACIFANKICMNCSLYVGDSVVKDGQFDTSEVFVRSFSLFL